MDAIKLGLIGSAGRMGTALAAHLEDVEDINIHATLEIDGDCQSFVQAGCGIILDLSTGPAVDVNGPLIVSAGLPYIVGATGYQAGTVDVLRRAAERSSSPVLLVPNFSLGANLMLLAAASAAKLMDSPVITERHHAGKADAPSGTARYTAERIAAGGAAASAARSPGSTASRFTEQLPGVLGGEMEGAVAIHSVRGAGYLAEQQVSFCLPGESLTIEHRSIDRRCFMPGIVYAIRNIGRVQGLRIGLDTILEP